MAEPLTKPVYYSYAYGCCVQHGGYWFYVNHDWGITRTRDPPTGRTDLLGNKWFAPQVLLEYAQLITDVYNSCEKPDVMWPITLVQTAEKIDLLTKTLASFQGKDHKVNERSHGNQWTVGELLSSNELTPCLEHGRVFIYDHAGSELALCIGLTSSSGATNKGNSQEPFSAIQASYGKSFKTSLHNQRQCSLADFQKELCNTLKQCTPEHLHGFKETSDNLLKLHECDFARQLRNAMDHERKKRASIDPEESRLAAANNKVENLQNELSEYRATLGSLSSGLNSMNISEDASLPPLCEVLETYEKLVITVEKMYEDIVLNELGNVDSSLQLMFVENLSAVLHKMREVAHRRYIGLVKVLSGCADLAKLSTISINKCDIHCRQHWEYLFMPLVDELIGMSTKMHNPVERDMSAGDTCEKNYPLLKASEAPVSSEEQESSLEACPEKYNGPSGSDIKYQQASDSSQKTPATQVTELSKHGDANPKGDGEVVLQMSGVHGKPGGSVTHDQKPDEPLQEAPATQITELSKYGDAKPKDDGGVESQISGAHGKPGGSVTHDQKPDEPLQEAPATQVTELSTHGDAKPKDDGEVESQDTPMNTNEGFSDPMEWFFEKHFEAEGAFKRLWKVVICMFLQHPACAFQFMKNIKVGFQSETYRSLVDGPQEGDQVIVLFPPIRVYPKSMLATEIGEEEYDASKWTIMKKGVVDFLETE